MAHELAIGTRPVLAQSRGVFLKDATCLVSDAKRKAVVSQPCKRLEVSKREPMGLNLILSAVLPGSAAAHPYSDRKILLNTTTDLTNGDDRSDSELSLVNSCQSVS